MKLYEVMQEKQKCPYCKKNIYTDAKETAVLISAQGCMCCRIERKYFPLEKPLFPSTTNEDIFYANGCRSKGRYY